MHKIKEIFAIYKDYCLFIKNYSKYTIISREISIKGFLKETSLDYLEYITEEIAQEYLLNGRIKYKWKAQTYITHHKNWNVFCKWCVKRKYLTKNPFENIEKPRLEKILPKCLNKNEAELLLQTALHIRYRYTFERYRNYAIVATLLYTGIRRNELLSLKIGDIDFINKTLFINQGKGKKDRIIPINFELQRILNRYLQERKRLNRNCFNLFVSLKKDSFLTERGLRKIFDKLKRKSSLYFSTHTLRHSFATLMLEGGCDIYTLSKLMGHSDITTTTIYLSVSSQLLAKSIEKHPLSI